MNPIQVTAGIAFLISSLLIPTLSNAEEPKAIDFMVDKLLVEGKSPLAEETINELLSPHQSKRYNLDQLQAVAKSLEQSIRDQGYAFYRVVIPPQSLNQGQITLRIISFSLNEIAVEGNDYFGEDNIKASMPGLEVGQSPNTQNLSEYLKVANRHPSKQIKLTFKQSHEADAVDARLDVNEQRPYQASLIMNNTGTDKTGEFRMTAAVQHGNLWNKDHILNGSYTTSPDHMETVQQYGVNYSAPIYPLKGWISAYYAFSDVDTGVVGGGGGGDISVTGSGEMYGIHYLQYLPKLGRYEHWLDLGIDNRFFINDIRFIDLLIQRKTQIGTNVRSTPFSVLYKGEYPWQIARLNYHVQWVANTDFGGHNTQLHYSSSRFKAQQDWDLIRYGANLNTNLGQWFFTANLTGQYSHKPLISGEQIGIGGSYSVRGYNERETSADTGEVLKLELYTPRWQGINLLTFYDYGHGRQQSTVVGEKESWTLSSVGIGARYQWKKHLLASIDLAHTLDPGTATGERTNTGTNRIHASIVLRY